MRAPHTSGAARAPAASELQPLFARLRVAGVGAPMVVMPGRRQGELAALAQRIRGEQPAPATDRRPAPDPADAQGSRAPSPAPLSAHPGPAASPSARTQGKAAGAASTGDLWGAIAPCWRGLGGRGRAAVVLDVALDATGDLRVPPTVVRPATAPVDESRLQAEAAALAAVAACLPRGDPRFGGRTWRLEFPARP